MFRLKYLNYCIFPLGNELCEARAGRFCKLHQLGFVTQVLSVNLPKVVKPDMLNDL